MKLIEGVNIGKLPDIFETLTNSNQILKVTNKTTTLNDDYIRFMNLIMNQNNTYKELKEGDVVKGTIININNKEIIIDIGYKDYLYIENKSSDLKIIKNLKINDKIDAIIISISDNPFYMKGSVTELIKLQVLDKFKDYYNSNIYLEAEAKEMRPAGFMVNIEMDHIIINAFMPTTLAGINKLTIEQKEKLIGKKIKVMLETLQQDKGLYVVSRRKYLRSLIPETIKKTKKDFNENPQKIYDGFITGTTPFGVFIEFNKCLTGMIHRYNINQEWSKKENWDNIRPGMSIQFYIKEIILKKEKIILTQILRKSLWDSIRKNKILDGVVIDIKPFGALIKLDQETNGLIQNSYIKKNNINLKSGDKVSVRVLSIMKEDRKIYLAIEKKKNE